MLAILWESSTLMGLPLYLSNILRCVVRINNDLVTKSVFIISQEKLQTIGFVLK
jgi:hypothetical protein